jgi:hypothetical protein
VLLDPFGVHGHEAFEILEEHSLVVHETFHGTCPTDREVALEKDPIKTGFRSYDFFCILIDLNPSRHEPRHRGRLSKGSLTGSLLCQYEEEVKVKVIEDESERKTRNWGNASKDPLF